jgi:ATPase subunit of ABC transporter with duplicated ATPase domains
MSLIYLDHASLSFGDRQILDDVSFGINPGDKIGLVGHNGSGKSTLLKCLTGQLQLDKGAVIRRRNLGRIGYIEQDIPQSLENESLYDVLLDAIPADERGYNSWKADVALENIGTPSELWRRKISELSGGWRRLALIARTNLANPDLLILDEPTNYLDLEKIIRLENWLKTNVSVPYLLVSHDRQFLDNTTNRTLTLRAGKLFDHDLPCSKSRQVIAQQDVLDARKRNAQEEEIRRLERSAKRVIEWGKYNPSLASKGKTMEGRAEKLKEKITDAYKDPKRNVLLSGSHIRPNIVLSVINGAVATPANDRLFCIPELYVAKGDRITILGENGTGKTMLLKQLAAAFDNPDGMPAVRFNPQVLLGYFDQNMDSLPKNMGMSDCLATLPDMKNPGIVSSLANAGFLYKDQNKLIGALSFGERARFFFLYLHLQRKNFFILDEPTNHLDIDGQEKLENELLENMNTSIFVSHDRHFMQSVANRFFMIERGRLKEIDSPGVFYDRINTINQ